MIKASYTPEEFSSIVESVLESISSLDRYHVALSSMIGSAVQKVVPQERWPDTFRPMYKHVHAHTRPFGDFGLKVREVVLSSPLVTISDRDREYFEGFGEFRVNSVAIEFASEPLSDASTFCRDLLESVMSVVKDAPEVERRKVNLLIDLAKLLEHNPGLDDRQVARSFSFLVNGARHFVRE
jgi:hypothetical protein